MPGAYTDDGSAACGGLRRARVPWFVCMPRDTHQRERLCGMDRMGVVGLLCTNAMGVDQYFVGDCSSILNRCGGRDNGVAR
jgi:hypothetical protein